MWLGRFLCLAAGATVFQLARRDAFSMAWLTEIGLAPATAAGLTAVGVTALLLAASLKLSGRKVLLMGLHAFAFGGSLAILSSTTDLMAEDRLASLRELSVRQQAIFQLPAEGS